MPFKKRAGFSRPVDFGADNVAFNQNVTSLQSCVNESRVTFALNNQERDQRAMRTSSLILSIVLILPLSALVQRASADAARAAPLTSAKATIPDKIAELPPLPVSVSELDVKDFYKMPIGPRGMEPTTKLRSLGGKRVRLVGYMVREEEPAPGIFMLAPLPVQLAEVADGPADDLPATTVFVHMPAKDQDHRLPYRAGHWVLTGTLELGAKAEPNNRVSYTRLILDDSAANTVVAQEPSHQATDGATADAGTASREHFLRADP